MNKYAMNFYTRCTDPAREKEFNSWYSHTHLPALRLAKGLTSARRYICTDISCKAKYLAVYEFETEDIQESLRSFFRIVRQSFETGSHIDCIESISSVNTPKVACFKELLAEQVARLPCKEYPKKVPGALNELSGSHSL